ncbi:MAG: multicopper oxidase domain-containing protein [Rubrivivax sp.]|nr:multicopper oxidase domain-containing protein [Rubrivivax sp.]
MQCAHLDAAPGPIGVAQIANEAGLRATPVTRPSITLAPGERAELLGDFSGAASGQETICHASTPVGGMGMGMGMGIVGMGTGARSSSSSEVAAMKIRVSLPRRLHAIDAPPAGLTAAPVVVVAGAGATVRSFTLDGDMMGSRFTINGRSFDINRIPAGTVEVWRFVNATGMAHPMHVHGVRMSMLARGGRVPAAYERGTRDTFVVDAMQFKYCEVCCVPESPIRAVAPRPHRSAEASRAHRQAFSG